MIKHWQPTALFMQRPQTLNPHSQAVAKVNPPKCSLAGLVWQTHKPRQSSNICFVIQGVCSNRGVWLIPRPRPSPRPACPPWTQAEGGWWHQPWGQNPTVTFLIILCLHLIIVNTNNIPVVVFVRFIANFVRSKTLKIFIYKCKVVNLIQHLLHIWLLLRNIRN